MLKYHPFSDASLSHGQVDIWHVDLEKTYNIRDIGRILSIQEIERANRFVFPLHRARFRAAHIALRLILSFYLEESANTLIFMNGEYGKPALKNAALQFNLSHSGDYALIAVTKERSIGVDVECASKRDYLGIAAKSFSEKEQALLHALPEMKQKEGFFRIWTQKEAFIKLLGFGLHYPLKSFSVAPAGPETLLSVENDDVSAYDMQRFMIADHLYGAVCGYHPLSKVMHYQFRPQMLKEGFKLSA